MPATMRVKLPDVTGEIGVARLHGAACALFEDADTDHRAQRKPLSAGPVRDQTWRLGWLADSYPPAVPTRIRFGGAHTAATLAEVRHHTYAELAAMPPARSAELTVDSPMYFSRNGRDLPLPDPVLILRSAVDRWNHHAPAPLRIADEQSGELLAAVRLAGMAGRTKSVTVGPGLHQTGFVGAVRLALPARATPPTCATFAAMARYAEIAGAGARTAYGFGAATLTRLGDPR